EETERRRGIQEAYNKAHNITPTTIKKAVRDLISITKEVEKTSKKLEKDPESMSKKELKEVIGRMEKEMRKAAADLNFEAAMELRDKIREMSAYLND
ncbi:MAG: UvrB/UvrC motif-containing protein, partial [Lachnospiraceae bacterium]|nr:UvrB/UvrC motif-containing protein [Lachnospiraceae bacterium]